MSSFKPCPPSDGNARCDDCGKVTNIEDLDWIADAEQRLFAGEQVPAGQCPDCGACAHVYDDQPEIDSMMTISTAHVTRETGQRLEGGHDHIKAINGLMCDWSIYGWVYWTDAEPDDSIPDELAALSEYAKARGCKYIKFDCDGPTLSQFPIFDW